MKFTEHVVHRNRRSLMTFTECLEIMNGHQTLSTACTASPCVLTAPDCSNCWYMLQECTKLTADNSTLDSEVEKLSAEKEKEAADRSRLESENASVGEEKKKLLLTLQTAKQRLVALRTDKENLESSCAELKRQLDAATAERESVEPPSNQPSIGM